MSESSERKVSVVLLSYNRPGHLRKALASLSNQSYEDLEITVVDNQSPTSDEVASIVGEYPGLKLLRNERNVGFAAGMNKGIQLASGAYVFLTEDDILLAEDCIERLVGHMRENPFAALVAPIIYNHADKTIRCAGGEFSLAGVYRKKMYGVGERDSGQFSKPFSVDFIDGASMFARRNFWEDFKGFREEYFMYAEAIELCARVGKAGKKMTVVPQAKVYHIEPSDENTSPEFEFHRTKNFFSLYLLHAPARYLPEFFCRYAVLNTVRTLLGRTRARRRPHLMALFWVLRRTPSLIKERLKSKRPRAVSEQGFPG